MSQIIATAEPFFFLGDRSKPACLLIHGFTGTPKEMRWMGKYLHQQGFTCLGVRLAGHATTPQDMIASHWTDWTASVEDAYSLLKNLTDDIYLVGLSMGGILSLLISTRLQVKGVVAMSTPYKLRTDPRLRYIKLISRVVRAKNGTPLGCYLYYGQPGGMAIVLQIFSGPENADTVVRCLLADANERGCAAVRGRVQPDLLDALQQNGCIFKHVASLTIHARNAELLAATRAGNALVTGLAGESWTRLYRGKFV